VRGRLDARGGRGFGLHPGAGLRLAAGLCAWALWCNGRRWRGPGMVRARVGRHSLPGSVRPVGAIAPIRVIRL